jgi:soluble lytic murein transglycosylase-like protein
VVFSNNVRYICFLVLAILMLPSAHAAAPADASAHPEIVVRADKRSGRLVRTVVAPKPAREHRRADPAVDRLVRQAAETYHVDPLLVRSVIRVESDFNPYAISSKGAEGLMQLIPATARRFGVTDSFNPKENIEAGVRYLKYLQTVFGDDRLALAAYNAGEGAVAKYNWIPPYPETQDYVKKVGKEYAAARSAAEKQAAAETVPKKSASKENRHPKLEEYKDEQGRIFIRTR